MNQYQKALLAPSVKPFLRQARFGLEKESQRIDRAGQLAQTGMPAAFGSRDFHPYIQTDFAETQLEAITPVFDNEAEAVDFLRALTDVIQRSLPENERIWPLSMPPELPEDDAQITLAQLSDPADRAYRAGLAKKYGKRKQMVSGIHFNFEFDEDLLRELWALTGTEQDFAAFRTACYLKVARGYTRYQWLVTYLFGASPRAAAGYFTDGTELPVARSIRNSDYGYHNVPECFVSLDSLAHYYQDLENLISTDRLSQMKEFYSPVRLRGGGRLENLLETGVRYLELRNLDLSPFENVGISVEACQFLHYFCLFLLYRDETADLGKAEQELGSRMNAQVALENPFEQTAFYEEGLAFFAEFLDFARALGLSVELIKGYAQLLRKPELTPAARLENACAEQPDFALKLAESYHEKSWLRPYQLAGFEEMELSTQNLIFDALQKGLKLEVLDRKNQILQLTYGDHSEIVKDGNMTARDSLISYEIMKNKTVTKILLARAGFRVPAGREFVSTDSACQHYPIFQNQPIVVKPKSTNYGLGISIFQAGATREAFEQAVRVAFDEDSEVLVERFAEGTEYRFFVVDGETKAVLRRDNANVVGDGLHTVEQLIDLKNQDPLRGEHYHAPLEKIQKGQAEKRVLAMQGLQLSDVPAADQHVLLRDNSNISTGGDSIDVTDLMDEHYKRIAEAAARTLGVKITGLDLMIPDLTAADGDYTIIEANFNPMMHMHLYPYQGKPRRATMDVLNYLFPEIFN